MTFAISGTAALTGRRVESEVMPKYFTPKPGKYLVVTR